MAKHINFGQGTQKTLPVIIENFIFEIKFLKIFNFFNGWAVENWCGVHILGGLIFCWGGPQHSEALGMLASLLRPQNVAVNTRK